MRLRRLTDEAIAEQLGKTLRAHRLRMDMTQDQLAEAVGVSTPTIQSLEKGKGTLAVFIAALRALNCLDLLSNLLTEPRSSPLAVVKTERRRRVRASGRAVATATLSGAVSVLKGNAPAATLLIPKKGVSDGENS